MKTSLVGDDSATIRRGIRVLFEPRVPGVHGVGSRAEGLERRATGGPVGAIPPHVRMARRVGPGISARLRGDTVRPRPPAVRCAPRRSREGIRHAPATGSDGCIRVLLDAAIPVGRRADVEVAA